MRLSASLRAGVAAICIAAVAAPAGFAETPPAAQRLPGSALSVSVAQSNDFSRIEFRFAGGARMTSRRKGQTLVLRFNRYARPDMTRLRVDPPRWLKTASERDAGGLEIVLTLADDADARVGEADGAAFVNLFARPAVAQASSAKPAAPAQNTPAQDPRTQTALSVRPDPTPASGVVRMQAEMVSGRVLLRFPWKNPLGAAVFRRGEAVWVVFDAPARIDVSSAPHGFRQVRQMQTAAGLDFSAVRIASPSDVGVSAVAEGAVWTVTLGTGQPPASEAVKITRDTDAGSPSLSASLAGATRAVWVDDPAVGDRIGVVTAMAPCKGLPSRREFVDLALLPSVQGLAVEPIADGLAVTTDGDNVSIGMPKGLALSPKALQAQASANDLGLPQPLVRPGLVDFDTWGRTGSGGYLPRYEALQMAAAEEGKRGKDAGFAARLGLARFLVGEQLSYEAIGVLNMIGKQQESMLGDAQFRALRGAAKVMAGRYKEAQTDFSAPVLADDPASSLWRGYIAARLGQWTEARQQFDAGQSMLFQFPAKWRTRFATANAEAAIALNQYPVAEVAIDNALRDQPDPVEQLQTRLVQARLFEAEGEHDRALRLYQAIAPVNLAFLSAPALLHATEIRLAANQITPMQAAGVYDGLRFRWRGDATELETIRDLGQIYLGLGRYREALEALRSAGQRLPDLPQAVQLQADLSNAFRALFLDGQADGLQPVQALALFYDFKELTPIGADGDLMVRKLARRLVDVDLLGQAADLLKYQADNRLSGVPRAEVATDLAMIDLMNRQPEAALDALNNSRTTLLPSALNAQRRLIEARAWLGLGQYDHSTEVMQADKGPDADAIRAEISWKKHDWSLAGGQFEKLLGDRFKAAGPLGPDDEARLLRAAIGYSLAGDEASLGRLRDRYQGFVAQSRQPDALRVALSGPDKIQVANTDFTRLAAENDTFVGWVQAMKQRFRDRPAPTSPTSGLSPPPQAAPAKTASAGGPSQG
ncbi:MAG: tetratricopeptide repeat protein [Caulobacteraceae bacterium]|nr:tetratricopeptide repeat protein [Caulobacteraceae bacterium]